MPPPEQVTRQQAEVETFSRAVPEAPRVAEAPPPSPAPAAPPPVEVEKEKVTAQQAEAQTFERPIPEAPPVAEAPPPPPAPVPEVAPPVQPPEQVARQQAEVETFSRAVPEAPPPPVAEVIPPEAPPPAPTPLVEEAPPPPAPAAPLVLADPFFDYDRFTLRNDAIAALEENARRLKAHNSTTILIEGHADERGTLEYNLVLGEHRARAVKQYLEDLGLPASSLKIVSYGKERPFCTEHSDVCWQQNRRAHLVIQ